MVLTSPNMDYVPAYPVESSIIDISSDGRWGVHEFSRWPQVLQPNMWHLACIPSRPIPPDVPEVLWDTFVPETHWVEDYTIAFHGIGYIETKTQDALIVAAKSAIRQCEEMKAPEQVAKYGRGLVMILRQVVDRMRSFPVVAGIAVAVAAHVQRICLELAGLKTYVEVVAPRLASDRDHCLDVLPVLGAFVRNGSDARTCLRVGLPTWALQPLTHELAVWEVVECRTPSFGHAYAHSVMHAEPRIPHERQRVVGVPKTIGDLDERLYFLSQQATGNSVTSAPVADVPGRSQEEHPAKRPRVESKVLSTHYSLVMPVAAFAVPKNTKIGSKKGQGKMPRTRVQPAPAPSAQRPSTVSRPPKAKLDMNPSKYFTPSPFYDVPPVWAAALQAVSPAPRALSSATYFFPPPFLLDTISSIAGLPPDCKHPELARPDEKVHRYIHNFARIREFCRTRLFKITRTIANEPLTIVEWRCALWGDYLLALQLPSEESPGLQGRQFSESKQDRWKRLSWLFGNVARLRSYREDEVLSTSLGGTDIQVDLGAIASNPALRSYILWETHEVNFRAELLCLDTLMLEKRNPCYTSRISSRIEREFLVSKVWGSTSTMSIVPPDGPPRDHTFLWFSPPGQEWERCCEALRTFAGVLASWPDPGSECPDEVRQGLPEEVDEETFARVQMQAVEYYVRVFVKTFARLPIPPISFPTI